mgnify:CR=1 FL=1
MNSELQKRIISSIILIPLSLYFIISGSHMLIFFTFICFFVSCYEWHMMSKKKIYNIFGFPFLIFSFYTFYKLSLGLSLVFFIILICISTDIGGYVFGKIFKGPKLTKISPNKTYSGMLGGFFFSLTFMLFYFNWANYEVSIKWFLITILISTVSQIGDLIISYFKRSSKIKNTGNIIPGHGGLLDRIDGMIFVFPFVYLITLISIIIKL